MMKCIDVAPSGNSKSPFIQAIFAFPWMKRGKLMCATCTAEGLLEAYSLTRSDPRSSNLERLHNAKNGGYHRETYEANCLPSDSSYKKGTDFY